MKELQELARNLLAAGEVGFVVGWEEGPRGPRPAFVTHPEETGRLVFDERCVHNLTAYLDPRRSHLRPLGKAAVVVKPCDARAAAGLLRESQLARGDVVLIGVRCGGVRGEDGAPAARCARCDAGEPKLADHVLGEPRPSPARPEAPDPLAAVEAMSAAERREFWRRELARCVRCHACREVCPLCYCDRCAAEKTVPQWIESSPHGRGNLAWHLTRALHLAGRCVGCGECARACPTGVPLALLGLKMARVVEERFGHRPTDDPGVPAPIGRYEAADAQEFIL